MDLKAIYKYISEIPNEFYSIRNEIKDLKFTIFNKPKEKEPLPFCVVFILGYKKSVVKTSESNHHQYDFIGFSNEVVKLEPISLADSAFIDTQHLFRIQPHYTIEKLQIVIITDLHKVRLDNITCGNQTLSASNENCPITYFNGIVTPANVISIQVSQR